MSSFNHQSSEQQTTDELLMLAYAKGDASAFDKLYHRHKKAVFLFFIKQNTSAAVAEELCHDTWLKLINAREKYEVSALFRTYLFTIARHVMIDFFQKKSTQNEQTFTEHVTEQTIQNSVEACEDNVKNTEDAEKPSTVNNYQMEQLKQALNSQILQLPFEQRQVFLLKQEAGFTVDQIAKITQDHKEKVKSHWRYALQKIRKGLTAYVN